MAQEGNKPSGKGVKIEYKREQLANLKPWEIDKITSFAQKIKYHGINEWAKNFKKAYYGKHGAYHGIIAKIPGKSTGEQQIVGFLLIRRGDRNVQMHSLVVPPSLKFENRRLIARLLMKEALTTHEAIEHPNIPNHISIPAKSNFENFIRALQLGFEPSREVMVDDKNSQVDAGVVGESFFGNFGPHNITKFNGGGFCHMNRVSERNMEIAKGMAEKMKSRSELYNLIANSKDPVKIYWRLAHILFSKENK